MPRELRNQVAAEPPDASLHPTSFIYWLRDVRMLDPETKLNTSLCIWLFLLLLQSILGPMRRRMGHWRFVQYGAMASFYLPIHVSLYAASTSFSYSGSTVDKSGATMVCSAVLWASTYFATQGLVMTAYTRTDGLFQLLRLLPSLLHFVWLQWDYILMDKKLMPLEIINFFVASFYSSVANFVIRPGAATLERKIKAFADYMAQESKSRSPFFDGDANSLQNGCKYPIIVKDGQWVTIQDVLHQSFKIEDVLHPWNQLLRHTADPDIFLSYSFCCLLARRYFGFPCPEEGNAKVQDFVLTHLLPDYKRAFTIVEVQLAFLHDYFFTSFHKHQFLTLLSVKKATKTMSLSSVTIWALLLLKFLFNDHRKGLWKTVWEAVYSTIVQGLLVVTLILIVPKYWRPIQNVVLYYPTATGRVRRPSTIGWYAQRNESTDSLQKSCWREKLGQYSLIKDYDRHSYKKAFVAWFKERMLSQVVYSFIKHHPGKEEDISVPDSVKRLVAVTLRGINGPPTNGTRSLWRNRNLTPDVDPSWTCRQDTYTRTILIWHIATSYLDMFLLEETGATSNHEVAIALSKYCAYLVAFLPEFLPEQIGTTTVLLQQVIEETKDLLGSAPMPLEEKHARIQGLELPDDEDSHSTFQKGVRLGRQLKKLDPLVHWKVAAEFWAETILYVAPSDKVTAHIDQLARGGEFVTHLWAMLSNAGILKRVTEEWTPPQPAEPVVVDSDIAREQQDMPQPGPGASDSDIMRRNLRLRRSKSLTTISGSSRNTRA